MSTVRCSKGSLVKVLSNPKSKDSDLETINDQIEVLKLIEKACADITLSPHQLWRFLSEEEIDDIRNGHIGFDTLTAYTQRLNNHLYLVPEPTIVTYHDC